MGSYQIYDIPPRAAGKTRLKVTYRYNRNQIVEVDAEDLQDRRKLPTKKIEDVDLNKLLASSSFDPSSLKLLVTSPGFDDIGNILRLLDFDSQLYVRGNRLDCDILFLNCGTQAPPDPHEDPEVCIPRWMFVCFRSD